MNCMAAVAIMATGTSIDEYEEFVKDKDYKPYSDKAFWLYLLEHDLAVGMPITRGKDKKLIFFADEKILLHDYAYKGKKALVIVKSKSGKGAHAIYWDGYKLYDSTSSKSLPISSYIVYDWFPIFNINNRLL